MNRHRNTADAQTFEKPYNDLLNHFLECTSYVPQEKFPKTISEDLIQLLSEKFYESKRTPALTQSEIKSQLRVKYSRIKNSSIFVFEAFQQFYFNEQTQEEMNQKVNEILSQYGLKSRDLTNSWKDGTNFLALLSYLSKSEFSRPTTMTFQSLSKRFSELNIPFFIPNSGFSQFHHLLYCYQIEILLSKIDENSEENDQNDFDSFTATTTDDHFVQPTEDDEIIDYSESDSLETEPTDIFVDDAIPKNAYVNILNSILAPNEEQTISLLSELNNGVIIPSLINEFFSKTVPDIIKDPKGFQKDHNNQKSLKFLQKLWPAFDADAFNFSEENDQIDFLRILLKTQWISSTCHALLESINGILDYEGRPCVTNLNKDWDNGQSFVALVRFLSEDSFSFSEYTAIDFTILKSLFKEFGVPLILDETSIFGNPDEIAIIYQINSIIETIEQKGLNIPTKRMPGYKSPKKQTSSINLRVFNALGDEIGLHFDKIINIFDPIDLPKLVKFVLGVSIIPGISLTNPRNNLPNLISFLKDENPEFTYEMTDSINEITAESFASAFLKCFFLKKKDLIDSLNILIGDSFFVKNYSDFRFGSPFYPLLYLIIKRRIQIGFKPLKYYNHEELSSLFFKAAIPYLLDFNLLAFLNHDAIDYQLQFMFNKLNSSNTPAKIVQYLLIGRSILSRMHIPDIKKIVETARKETVKQKLTTPPRKKCVIPKIRRILAHSANVEETPTRDTDESDSILLKPMRSDSTLPGMEALADEQLEEKIRISIAPKFTRKLYNVAPPVIDSEKPRLISSFNNEISSIISKVGSSEEKLTTMKRIRTSVPKFYTIFRLVGESWNFLNSQWEQFCTDYNLDAKDQFAPIFFMSYGPEASSISSTIMQFGLKNDKSDSSDPIVQIALMGTTSELNLTFKINTSFQSYNDGSIPPYVLFINLKFQRNANMDEIIKMAAFLTAQSTTVVMPNLIYLITEMTSHFKSVARLLPKDDTDVQIPFILLLNDKEKTLNSKSFTREINNKAKTGGTMLHRILGYFEHSLFSPSYQWIDPTKVSTYTSFLTEIVQNAMSSGNLPYLGDFEDMFHLIHNLNPCKEPKQVENFLKDLYQFYEDHVDKHKTEQSEIDQYRLFKTTAIQNRMDEIKRFVPKLIGISNTVQSNKGKIITIDSIESEDRVSSTIKNELKSMFDFLVSNDVKTGGFTPISKIDTTLESFGNRSTSLFSYNDHQIIFHDKKFDEFCKNNKIGPSDDMFTILVSNSDDSLILPILSKISRSAILFPNIPPNFNCTIHFCGFIQDLQALFNDTPMKETPKSKTGIFILVPHKPNNVSTFDILNMESLLAPQCDCLLTLTSFDSIYNQSRVAKSIKALTLTHQRKSPNVVYLFNEKAPSSMRDNPKLFASFCEHFNRFSLPTSKFRTTILKNYIYDDDFVQWIDADNWGSYYSLYRTLLIACSQQSNSNLNKVQQIKPYFSTLPTKPYCETFISIFQNRSIDLTTFEQIILDKVFKSNEAKGSQPNYFTLSTFNEIIADLARVLDNSGRQIVINHKTALLQKKGKELLNNISFDSTNNSKLKSILNYIDQSVTYIPEKMKTVMINSYITHLKDKAFSQIKREGELRNYGMDFCHYVYRMYLNTDLAVNIDKNTGPINEQYAQYAKQFTKEEDEEMDLSQTLSQSMKYVMTETQVLKEICVEITTEKPLDVVCQPDF